MMATVGLKRGKSPFDDGDAIDLDPRDRERNALACGSWGRIEAEFPGGRGRICRFEVEGANQTGGHDHFNSHILGSCDNVCERRLSPHVEVIQMHDDSIRLILDDGADGRWAGDRN